jgi:spore germination protein KC
MGRLAKFVLLILLVLLTAAFAAVGDSKDINNKLIATTIAVDVRDGEFWFYVEFANIQAGQSSSSGSGGGSTPKYTLVKGHGKTLPEARQNFDRQLDKPLFISDVRTLLITENFAREHLLEYLYRLRADETYRKKVITLVTRDNLDTLFKTLMEQNQSLGYSAENTVTTLESSGEGFSRTTSRLLENLTDSYTGILIPCIGLQEQEIALTGYSVVNDTRVIGFIPIADCKGLNILKTDKAKSFYIIPLNGIQYTVEADLTKRTTQAFYENGTPAFKISLSFDATLEYGDKKLPYGFNDADNKQMTGMLERMIDQDVRDAIYQAQTTFHTDYLQLDDAFRVAFPVIEDSMDWNEAFARAAITPEVKVNLKSTYMMDYGVDQLR